MTIDDPQSSLAATDLVDSDHPAVREFAARHAEGGNARERAVALYYAVRDRFRYDPYRIDLSPRGMRASTVLEIGYGWCVTKAALMAAACRAAGIPARMGFADVRNHLSTQRMRETMETDVFTWHGYADVWIDGSWVKATPAFNLALCERFGLHPLEFDGREDSIYHAFDRSGQRHMEYLADRGRYADVPLAELVADFRLRYPRWLAEAGTLSALSSSDFLSDVAREPGIS
ncbi:transglutaminase family protein [Ramlibacter monticola]|uniref:Transglutaminase family protein n=1 Tax=Ramlibacter monticola TaxID=1926872 RepID=A0A936Z4D0_9BURK|nr:transglutaminase family protein [Ramlibacter monticola]MBL0393689.1 transglutaminase family protein [Ramlibacter monticola]